MILQKDEKVHVIFRRAFENDIRRHFVGTAVSDAENNLIRLQGYVFVWDAGNNRWEKRPEKRTRIIALDAESYIINILPPAVEIEKLHYAQSAERHLVLTDGAGFSLDINEFGLNR